MVAKNVFFWFSGWLWGLCLAVVVHSHYPDHLVTVCAWAMVSGAAVAIMAAVASNKRRVASRGVPYSVTDLRNPRVPVLRATAGARIPRRRLW